MPNKYKSKDGKIAHCPHCRGVIFTAAAPVEVQKDGRMLFTCKHCGKAILVLAQDGQILIRKGVPISS